MELVPFRKDWRELSFFLLTIWGLKKPASITEKKYLPRRPLYRLLKCILPAVGQQIISQTRVIQFKTIQACGMVPPSFTVGLCQIYNNTRREPGNFILNTTSLLFMRAMSSNVFRSPATHTRDKCEPLKMPLQPLSSQSQSVSDTVLMLKGTDVNKSFCK